MTKVWRGTILGLPVGVGIDGTIYVPDDYEEHAAALAVGDVGALVAKMDRIGEFADRVEALNAEWRALVDDVGPDDRLATVVPLPRKKPRK